MAKGKRYIIQLHKSDRYLGAGFLVFDWVNGRRYPEAFGNGEKAHLMTERQKDYFEDVLSGNGASYKIIEVI